MVVENIIPESDLNEKKVAAASAPESAQDNTGSLGDASPPLFDAFAASGDVSEPTEGAVMPDAPIEKRGRGRPRKDGTAPAGKKKAAAKPTPDQTVAVAVANAQIVVGALDLMRAAVSGGECPENPDLRGAAVGAWAEYLESEGMTLPPWVQVAIISVVYVAPAFGTPTGKGRISGLWAKARAWWIARKG